MAGDRRWDLGREVSVMVQVGTVQVERAQVADCAALAGSSQRAFERDVELGASGPGGPPGYDSPAWHRRAFTWAHVFRIVHEGRIVGGAIVIPHAAGRMELGRIWLEPSAQGHGWGVTAMAAIECQGRLKTDPFSTAEN